MNKEAFYEGYMSPSTGMEKVSAPALNLLGDAVRHPGMLLGAPIIAGYAGGKVYSALNQPSPEELNQIQAEYVKLKFQQAIDDLDKKKKIEQMKENNLGTSNTLRI